MRTQVLFITMQYYHPLFQQAHIELFSDNCNRMNMEEASASSFLPDLQLPSYHMHVFLTRVIAQLSKFRPPTIVSCSKNTYDDGDTRNTFVRNQLPQEQTAGKGNVFSRLPAAQLSTLKPLMLTLHCLFPNELLPALDILDRKLVGRFYLVTDTDSSTDLVERKRKLDDCDDRNVLSPAGQGHTEDNNDNNNNRWPREEHYFVRSTTSTTATATNNNRRAPEKTYEVRLRAWNCTCPAFTLSVFRELVEPAAAGTDVNSSMAQDEAEDDDDDDDDEEDRWFGGTLARARSKTSPSPPACCKHLLACVLASRCPALFGDGVDERHGISVEELAGWYAGWGD